MQQLKLEMQVTAPALKLQRWQQRIKDNPLDLYVANRRVVHTRNWLIRVCSSRHVFHIFKQCYRCLLHAERFNRQTNLTISLIRLQMSKQACMLCFGRTWQSCRLIGFCFQPTCLTFHTRSVCVKFGCDAGSKGRIQRADRCCSGHDPHSHAVLQHL